MGAMKAIEAVATRVVAMTIAAVAVDTIRAMMATGEAATRVVITNRCPVTVATAMVAIAMAAIREAFAAPSFCRAFCRDFLVANAAAASPNRFF